MLTSNVADGNIMWKKNNNTKIYLCCIRFLNVCKSNRERQNPTCWVQYKRNRLEQKKRVLMHHSEHFVCYEIYKQKPEAV